ncbi:MAG: glycoside hydrolase family 2 TIM barrel-domain containing protein [Elusimicrobiales bacterium]|jgi:beta-glucuronidase
MWKPNTRELPLLLFLSFCPAAALPQELLTNVENRRLTSLDGPWNYIVDPYETGYFNYRRQPYDRQKENSNAAFYNNYHAKDGSELVEYDFDKSPALTVPGDWNSQKENLFYYEGTVWFKKSFDFAFSKKGGRLFVYFGAANYKAEVYLNGVKLGAHEGGFTPFNFEITRLVKPKDNYLVVKVDDTRRQEAVPTLSTDWWNYGGLTREVLLIEEPESFVRDYTIQLKKGSSGVIAGSVELAGAQPGEKVSVIIPELKIDHVMTVDAAGAAGFEIEAKNIRYWSPSDPKLYEVFVRTEKQSLRDDIGFRTIETRGPELLLNGSPVFLRGISIHEENALKGARAHSEADAMQALGWAKELGCNYVRLAHYPHNEHMLRLADKLGLMVWEEIPVYWTVDFADAATLAGARNQLSEVITRDRNRASVIIWSMANETPPSDARNAFLLDLISTARSLDPTRLISAALETRQENGASVVDDKIGKDLDIIAFNEYRGWYGGGLSDAPDAKWEIRFDKPVVVSEFGGDALQGLHGTREERWTEEYQEYLYRQNLAMLEKIRNFRGVSPWILADFRSPRRLLPGIQDGYNRKGLISDKGLKKKAFFILRDFYRKMETLYK